MKNKPVLVNLRAKSNGLTIIHYIERFARQNGIRVLDIEVSFKPSNLGHWMILERKV